MSSTTIQVVKAGSCMNGGDGRICALQEGDCPDATVFTTPRQLDQSGGGVAHGGACVTRSGTEDTAKIGWCREEGCTSDASACKNPSAFVSVDDRCTIRTDSTKDGKERDTLFGMCNADLTCYWSDADCSSGWRPAYANAGCTCDKVRVGACFDQGFYYCAVSADACDESADWFGAKALQGQANAPACFLCVAKLSPVVNPAPVAMPTFAPIVSPPAHPFFKQNHKSSKQQNVVLIATLGSLGVLIFLSASVIFLRRNRSPSITNKDVSDIPMETATVSQINVGYEEDNMSDI